MNGASGKQSTKPRMPQARSRRTISLPILIGTVVTLLILLPGLYFWRLRQVQQGANVYLERAETLAKEEEWAKSADYLHLYLRLRPDDAAARVQLAETADRAAVQRPQILRAIELYYQALAEASPEEASKIRLRLGELLIQSEQFASAIEEADKLMTASPEDPEANRLLALALYGAGTSGGLDRQRYKFSDVGSQLEKAFELKPSDVALATTLADVLRKHPDLQSETSAALSDAERAAIVERYFDQLVAAAPREASAYLARYQDRLLRAGSQSKADDDIRMALELGPENPVVLVAAASHEQQAAARENVAEARAEHLRLAGEYYGRAMREAPRFDRAYVGLGEVQQLSGDTGLAVETWQRGIEECGSETVILHALLADEFITQRKFQAAEDHLKRIESLAESLRRRGLLESQLTFARSTRLLSARLKLAQMDIEGGRAILQELAKGPKGDSVEGTVTYHALMMLAGTYAAQDREAAATIYAQAAATLATHAEPYLAVAALNLAGGDPDRAVASLEKALSISDSPDNRLLLVGALIQAQLKRPLAQRNWERVEGAIASARQSIVDSDAQGSLWRLGVLEADYRSRRAGGTIDARAAQSVLLSTENAMTPTPNGLVQLAEAYARYGFLEDEDRVLERLRTTYPGSTAAILATARSQSTRGQLEAARITIANAIDGAKPDQRRSLTLVLAGLLAEQGNSEEAWQLLSELHRQEPQERETLQQLMELALRTDRTAEAKSLEAEFAKLPAVSNAEVQYFRVRRLLAADPSPAALQEAEQLIAEIKQQVPEGSAAYVLEAEVLERKGFTEKAVEAYQQAIQRGDRQLTSFERLIVLLNQLGRFSEAADYLAALQGGAPQLDQLSTLEIFTALGSGQTDTALKLARQRVAKRPDDPLAQIWLGQVLMASNDFNSAEQALAKALELAPTDQRAQGAMLGFLVRSGQNERARTKLHEFVDGLKVTPVQKALILAAGLESMGAREEALAQLRQAEQLEPNNVKVQERIGMALVLQQPDAAEKALRRALELDPNSAVARRALAAMLADRGDRQAAIAFLTENGATTAAATRDREMHAALLISQGGDREWAEAEQILTKLADEGSITARFMLAQLTELKGNPQGAGEQYLALASRPGPQPAHVAAYVDWLLRQENGAEAAPWLDKLESLDPNGVDAVGLRVRWLVDTGREAGVESVIEGFAQRRLQAKATGQPPDNAQKLEVSRLAGDLYLIASDASAAERWHRRTFALDPAEYGRLANAVAKQGRVDEAVEICERAAATDPSHRPAQVLADVLVANDLGASASPAAARLLEEAATRHADQPELLIAIANLRIVQGERDEAIRLYRRIVELQPKNASALNNLAAILADDPKQLSEALMLSDKAIEIAGPQPNLLDTKGTVLLALGRTEEAIPLLRTAARSPNPDPRYLFHLAVGHSRTGEMGDARKALDDAQRRKLSETVLTKGDSEMLAELNERLR